MNNIHLDTKHQVFWLSYQYLTSQGIGENTISQWSKRNACKRKYIDGRAYINYDTIPVPTRKNLPAKDELKEEYNRQKSGYYESWYTRELKEAYESAQVPVWANLITNDKQYSKLKREQITSFARRAAVIEKAVELHKMHNAKGKLSGLYHAYTSLYKDYSRKNRFCMMLKKAKDKGVLSAAIDGRSIREFSPIYTAEYEQMAEMALSDRRSFDTATCHEMMQEACRELQIKTPSIWWLRQYYRRNRNFIDIERFGKNIYEKEQRPYANIIPALHRNRPRGYD